MSKVFKIAGTDDLGLEFEYQNEIYKIVEFRPRATKNPFIVQNIKTNQRMLIPLTDYILVQIRNGKVTDIK